MHRSVPEKYVYEANKLCLKEHLPQYRVELAASHSAAIGASSTTSLLVSLLATRDVILRFPCHLHGSGYGLPCFFLQEAVCPEVQCKGIEFIG